MKVAQENKERGSNEYIILLILTDDEIHDIENTIILSDSTRQVASFEYYCWDRLRRLHEDGDTRRR